MSTLELLQALWPIGLAMVGVVIWSIRQEGRINQVNQVVKIQQKEIDSLQVRQEVSESKALEKLSEISERLARIEGKLGQNPNA